MRLPGRRFSALVLGLAWVCNPETSWAAKTAPTAEYSFNYLISAPLAGTHDFVSNPSFQGLGIDAAEYLNDRASLGISLRWQRFSSHDPRQTFTSDTFAITGEQRRTQTMLPFGVRFKYDLGASTPMPFAAFGMGAAYGERFQQVGNFEDDRFGWQLYFAPEAGVYWESVWGPVGIVTSVRYDTGLGTDAFPAFSALSFSIGIRETM
jgi:hypothetical protein